MTLWPALGTVAIASVIMMAALWVAQKRTRDAGVVDVGWAFGIGAAAVFYAIVADGHPARKWIVGALAGLWGVRLATYLLFDRVLKGPEDGRYQTLREQWGGAFDRNIFWFFQAQAVLVIALSVPFYILASDPSANLSPLLFAGAAVWLIGIVGESIADRQLARFKRREGSKGRVCREGLWAWSRHPNYFFEWLVWLGVAIAALPSPNGWVALAAPAMMLLFILKITGIPPTEARSLQSRGDAYRAYQREVSAFLPLPPKKEGSP